MKAAAVLLVLLALVIGIVPQFTDCHSQGRMLTLTNGNKVDMKCHWSAMAEIALAAPLLVVGGLMAFARRREAQRQAAIMGGVLGALVAVVPTVLIGVCANEAMVCKSIMQPALILTGALAACISLATLVPTFRQSQAEQFA